MASLSGSRRDFLRAAISLGAIAALLAPLRAFALRICGRCGHEALGDETVCGHCGADLPPPAAPEPPAPEPEPEAAAPDPFAGVAHLAAEHARRAETFAEEEMWIGALLLARNARALYALSEAGEAARMGRLAQLTMQARRGLEAAAIDCPVCEGTGQRRTRMVTLQGDVVEQDVVGSTCGLCRGRRSIPARRSAADVQRVFAEAGRAFVIEQQGAGLTERFGIWVPAAVGDVIPARRLAAMRRAFDAWCPTCQVLGTTACARCRGAGALRCTNSNCLHGVETCPACGGRGRSDGRRCAACNGTGRGECAICEGQAYLPCTTCEGRGSQVCRTCGGEGYPAVCNRCDGQGTVLCRRCRGSGEQRGATCSICGGEGVTLCATCGGVGRRRR